MKIISVLCQKGGVGKTTTAEALISGLKRKGKKVLAIDLDFQKNLTNYLNPDFKKSIFDLVYGNNSIDDVIENDLIAGGTGVLLASEYFRNQSSNELLDKILSVSDRYDYCIIDTPPAINQVVHAMLRITDYVIIPCECTKDGLNGLNITLEIINRAKEDNNKLQLLGVILTKIKTNYKVHSTFIDAFSKKEDYKLFEIAIRESQAINNSKLLSKDFMNQKQANAVQDYYKLIDEVERRIL